MTMARPASPFVDLSSVTLAPDGNGSEPEPTSATSSTQASSPSNVIASTSAGSGSRYGSGNRPSTVRTRPRTAPGGPRKPTAKASLSNLVVAKNAAAAADGGGSGTRIPPLPAPISAPRAPPAPLMISQTAMDLPPPSYSQQQAHHKRSNSDSNGGRMDTVPGNCGCNVAELDVDVLPPLPASPISLDSRSVLSRTSSVSSTRSTRSSYMVHASSPLALHGASREDLRRAALLERTDEEQQASPEILPTSASRALPPPSESIPELPDSTPTLTAHPSASLDTLEGLPTVVPGEATVIPTPSIQRHSLSIDVGDPSASTQVERTPSPDATATTLASSVVRQFADRGRLEHEIYTPTGQTASLESSSDAFLPVSPEVDSTPTPRSNPAVTSQAESPSPSLDSPSLPSYVGTSINKNSTSRPEELNIPSPSIGFASPVSETSQANSVQLPAGTASPRPPSTDAPPSHLLSPRPSISSTVSHSTGTSSSYRTVKGSVAPSTTLAPPPLPSFTTPTIPFRALPLDAAQWTLTSSELQSIVSRAIRASAEPSAIRLLPLHTLDRELKEEVERLESEKARQQAHYRFVLQRRSMLMQALFALSRSPQATPASTSQSESPRLNTSPTSSAPPSPTPQSSSPPMADMIIRLSQTSAELDVLAQSLLSTTQQLGQLQQLQDVHAASALAVALRKLNASFARRTREIATLKERLEQVEAERDEAWRVAEEMAYEVDEREDTADDWEERTGDTVVVNVTDRAVAAPATFQRASRVQGVHLRVPGTGPRVVPAIPPVSDADQAIEGEAVAAAPPEAHVDGSHPLARSRTNSESKLTESGGGGLRPRSNSAASRVSAARTRSQRTSKASLRIPQNFGSGLNSASGSGRGPRSRSRSRARGHGDSRSEVTLNSPSDTLPRHPPLPSPISPTVNGVGGVLGGTSPVDGHNAVPDVPKLPDAESLSRMIPKDMAGPTSTSSAIPTTVKIPPIPVTGPPSGGPSSFLDMITRPNSVVGKDAAAAIGSNVGMNGNLTGSNVGQERGIINGRGPVADGTGIVRGQLQQSGDAAGRHDVMVTTTSANTTSLDDQGIVIVSPTTATTPHPFASPTFGSQQQYQALPYSTPPKNEHYSSSSQKPRKRQEHPFLKPSISSLKAPYHRPPPDSPIDVSGPSSTSSHGYDDDDDGYETVEDDDAELMDSFASAFGNDGMGTMNVTQYGVFATTGAGGRRGVQTQSLLPFPVARKGSLSRSADGSSGGLQAQTLTGGVMTRGSIMHIPGRETGNGSGGQSSQSQLPYLNAHGYQGMHPATISSSSSSPVHGSHPAIHDGMSSGGPFMGGDLNSMRRPTSLPVTATASGSNPDASTSGQVRPDKGRKERSDGWGYF